MNGNTCRLGTHPGQLDGAIGNRAPCVIILALMWIMLGLSRKALARLGRHMQQDLGDPERIKRLNTLERVFRYVATLVITLVGSMLVLSAVGISIAPILATAGVLGIAIGFGAKAWSRTTSMAFFCCWKTRYARAMWCRSPTRGGWSRR